MESLSIRLKRIKYLKAIAQYRKEGKNIVYIDETYLHSSHVESKGWFDDTTHGLSRPVSKGKRLIIVHAGGEDGFIQDGLLIFRSGELKRYETYIKLCFFRFKEW